MKKKIISLLLLLVIPTALLCGCDTAKEEQEKGLTENDINFICVVKPKNENGYYIYVHKETKVMYLVYKYKQSVNRWDNVYAYGITVMLNADGTPLLWDGEL